MVVSAPCAREGGYSNDDMGVMTRLIRVIQIGILVALDCRNQSGNDKTITVSPRRRPGSILYVVLSSPLRNIASDLFQGLFYLLDIFIRQVS